jgi:hypothetical protein
VQKLSRVYRTGRFAGRSNKSTPRAPSVYACYRFAAKLRAHSPLVEATLGAIVSALRAELPEYGKRSCADRSCPRLTCSGSAGAFARTSARSTAESERAERLAETRLRRHAAGEKRKLLERERDAGADEGAYDQHD